MLVGQQEDHFSESSRGVSLSVNLLIERKPTHILKFSDQYTLLNLRYEYRLFSIDFICSLLQDAVNLDPLIQCVKVTGKDSSSKMMMSPEGGPVPSNQ